MAVLLPSCTFLRDFLAKKNLASPQQKSLGFGVKKLSKHLLKLRVEEEGQEKLLPKTLQIWGGAKVGLNDLF